MEFYGHGSKAHLPDLPDLPNCQTAFGFRRYRLCELPTDKSTLILSTLTATEPVAAVFRARRLQPRRQKPWLTWRNRGSLVSGALSQEVRSWSALRSAGDVNNVYRNYDGRFRLHEEIVTFSERSYVKHSP